MGNSAARRGAEGEGATGHGGGGGGQDSGAGGSVGDGRSITQEVLASKILSILFTLLPTAAAIIVWAASINPKLDAVAVGVSELRADVGAISDRVSALEKEVAGSGASLEVRVARIEQDWPSMRNDAERNRSGIEALEHQVAVLEALFAAAGEGNEAAFRYLRQQQRAKKTTQFNPPP